VGADKNVIDEHPAGLFSESGEEQWPRLFDHDIVSLDVADREAIALSRPSGGPSEINDNLVSVDAYSQGSPNLIEVEMHQVSFAFANTKVEFQAEAHLRSLTMTISRRRRFEWIPRTPIMIACRSDRNDTLSKAQSLICNDLSSGVLARAKPVIASAAGWSRSRRRSTGGRRLAAVAPVNADGSRFHAALLADEALPCSCSPGEFAVRADALAVIPAIDRDTEALQVVLQTIRHEVPAIAADIDAVVLDNQQYTGYLAAAYRASQTKGSVGVGASINEAETVDQTSAPDFVRLRGDLGLPPPPST
jgi:hypothetical protein